ncbi:MAG: hypothetical protein K2L73_05580, partial [Muribaculaceae bacterium]|nr:hypothetical protein [Muribaculaceae bacterium]
YFDGWLLIPMYAALAFGGIYLYLRRRNYAVLAAVTLLFTVGVYSAARPLYADGDAYVLRSLPHTSIAVHHGDTMSVMTLAPSHRYSHDSLVIADRYRNYISTREIKQIEMMSLDSVAAMHGGILPFGRHGMRVAHLSDGEGVYCNTVMRCDYCLVTAKWYGDPVKLYHTFEADIIVLSTDINRRRRERYFRELKSAGIPVIDLGTQALASIPVGR